MCGSMVDIQSPTAEIRRGENIEEHRNIMSASTQGGHNYNSTSYLQLRLKCGTGLNQVSLSTLEYLEVQRRALQCKSKNDILFILLLGCQCWPL